MKAILSFFTHHLFNFFYLICFCVIFYIAGYYFHEGIMLKKDISFVGFYVSIATIGLVLTYVMAMEDIHELEVRIFKRKLFNRLLKAWEEKNASPQKGHQKGVLG